MTTPGRVLAFPCVFVALSAIAAGCGASAKKSATAPAGGATTAAPTVTTTTSSAAGALTAEAQAAAAGDIPDNQVFLTFHSATSGYSIKYPEGWLQRGSGQNVTFQDKNNRVRIVVSNGPAFSAASVNGDLASLNAANASFSAGSPTAIALPAGRAFKVSYATQSAPSAVTNKRVTLAVDRYYLSKGSKRAILDLGAPKGVDNVDAFRLIVMSFRWR